MISLDLVGMISLSDHRKPIHSDPEDEPGEPVQLPPAVSLMCSSQLVSAEFAKHPASRHGLAAAPAVRIASVHGLSAAGRDSGMVCVPQIVRCDECTMSCPFCGAMTSAKNSKGGEPDSAAHPEMKVNLNDELMAAKMPGRIAIEMRERPPIGRQRRKRVKKTVRLTNRIGLWCAICSAYVPHMHRCITIMRNVRCLLLILVTGGKNMVMSVLRTVRCA